VIPVWGDDGARAVRAIDDDVGFAGSGRRHAPKANIATDRICSNQLTLEVNVRGLGDVVVCRRRDRCSSGGARGPRLPISVLKASAWKRRRIAPQSNPGPLPPERSRIPNAAASFQIEIKKPSGSAKRATHPAPAVLFRIEEPLTVQRRSSTTISKDACGIGEIVAGGYPPSVPSTKIRNPC
jgi:hypothetical protein